MGQDEILQKLRRLKPRFEEMNIRRLALFGSVARNEARSGSDVDILIEFGNKPAGLIALSQKKREFEEYLGVPVDVVTFDAIRKPRQMHILKEAVDV